MNIRRILPLAAILFLIYMHPAASQQGQQEPSAAIKALLTDAEQGNAAAQYLMGLAYVQGRGVMQNPAEALIWLRKAAEQDHADAQHSLGLMYQQGIGVRQDYEEALKWYRKAAEKGQSIALNNLGLMYATGSGVPQDYAEAAKWIRKAAEKGFVGAQSNLGKLYSQGKGVTQDKTEAAKWYRLAAAQGEASAQYNLGIMYFEGQGVSQDYAEAARLYRSAAEQGYVNAQHDVGVMYLRGVGVPQDYVQAYFWLSLSAAAERGKDQEETLKLLNTIAERITPQQLAEAQRFGREWRPKGMRQGSPNVLGTASVTATPSPAIKSAPGETAKATSPASKIVPNKVPVDTQRVATEWGKWGGSLWPTEFKATPGISLDFYQPNNELPHYALATKGFPVDKTYHLWQKRAANAQPTRAASELSIRKSAPSASYGFAVTRADGTPVLLDAANFPKGAALDVALMSEDKSIVACAKIIPYPIENIQGSYRMWVELLSETVFTVSGEGFEPNSEILNTSTSEGEVLKSKATASPEGRFYGVAMPAVIGKKSGLATYSLVGKSGEVKVSYEWGVSSLNRAYPVSGGLAQNNSSKQPIERSITAEDKEYATLPPGKNLAVIFGDPAQSAFERGRAAQDAGNRESAIAEYSDAIRLKPDFAEAHLNLGNIYVQLGRAEEALVSYRECIRVKPDYALGHFAIGVWYGNRRQWPEAIEAYRAAVRLEPKNAGIQFNLGNAFLKSKRIEESIATFKDCLAADPGYAKGWMSLGMAYLFVGRRAEAIEVQAKLQPLDPVMAAQLQGLLDGKAQLPPLE